MIAEYVDVARGGLRLIYANAKNDNRNDYWRYSDALLPYSKAKQKSLVKWTFDTLISALTWQSYVTGKVSSKSQDFLNWEHLWLKFVLKKCFFFVKTKNTLILKILGGSSVPAGECMRSMAFKTKNKTELLADWLEHSCDFIY